MRVLGIKKLLEKVCFQTAFFAHNVRPLRDEVDKFLFELVV